MQAFQNYLLVGFWLLFSFNTPPKNNYTVFTDQKTVPIAQLIVPGKSIGQTKLQEDAVLVYKRLGRPDAGDAAMGKSLATWYAGHRSLGYQTQVFFSRYMGGMDDITSRVKQIRVTSPYFKTAEGIGPGSTLKQINAFFKVRKTAAFTENKQRYFVYDTFKGIAFESNAGGKCTGVIIYLLGGRGGFTYLPFHSN
ncbi:MAG: hypothetical protein V5804_13335 [Mucilaginibacter sp.]|uniref:hypothetical protein n=1 Tax=Mucilaginibacter sp. TaxID=1882438 RepID=UPI0034E61361